MDITVGDLGYVEVKGVRVAVHVAKVGVRDLEVAIRDLGETAPRITVLRREFEVDLETMGREAGVQYACTGIGMSPEAASRLARRRGSAYIRGYRTGRKTGQELRQSQGKESW